LRLLSPRHISKYQMESNVRYTAHHMTICITDWYGQLMTWIVNNYEYHYMFYITMRCKCGQKRANRCQLKACILSEWIELSSHVKSQLLEILLAKEKMSTVLWIVTTWSHQRPISNMRRKSVTFVPIFARVLLFPVVQETLTKSIKDSHQPKKRMFVHNLMR